MAGGIMTCRVCGKDYQACRNAKRNDGVYRWQDVACSPEHGAIYLDRIIKSRAKGTEVKDDPVNEAFALYDEEYLVDDVDDEMFYDEPDDAEEPEIEV